MSKEAGPAMPVFLLDRNETSPMPMGCPVQQVLSKEWCGQAHLLLLLTSNCCFNERSRFRVGGHDVIER